MKRVYQILLVMLVLASLVLTGCGQELPDRPFSLGEVSGNTYTSEYAGVTVELSPEWQMLSAQELQELPDNVSEMLEGSEAGEFMENYSGIMDMQATNPLTGSTVNINYTAIRKAERAAYAHMSEEESLDVVLKQYDMLVEAYEQMGVEEPAIEKITVNFLGEEHAALLTTGHVQGMNIYFVQVQNYKLGAYGATITATAIIEDTTQDILDQFQPLQ